MVACMCTVRDCNLLLSKYPNEPKEAKIVFVSFAFSKTVHILAAYRDLVPLFVTASFKV